MKLFTDLMKRLKIRNVQKCRRDAKLWMGRHNYNNVSDIKEVGYNDLPEYVQRYIISVASTNEVIRYMSLFDAQYKFNDYHDYEVWKVDSYGRPPMRTVALNAITSYSYNRQYTIFSKLFGTSVSKRLSTDNDKYEAEMKTFTCTPVDYNEGELILGLLRELCSSHVYTGVTKFGSKSVPFNGITSNILMNLYINSQINNLPFVTIIDRLSHVFSITDEFREYVLIHTCRHLGYTNESMVNIAAGYKVPNYEPKMVSLNDYTLRHLRDIKLHKLIMAL